MPGPGHYNPSVAMEDKHLYKNHGNTVFSKDKGHIVKLTPNYGPDPGTYRVQSDFGFYTPDDNAHNNRIAQMKKHF